MKTKKGDEQLFYCFKKPDMNNKTPNYVKIVISLTLINLAILGASIWNASA